MIKDAALASVAAMDNPSHHSLLSVVEAPPARTPPMVEDAAAAIKRVNDLTIELAKDICDSSTSIEGAHQLLMQAHRMLDQQYLYGVKAPAFQEKLADQRKREIAATIAENRKTLSEQLREAGIEPDPIFANRAPGGD